MKSFLILEKFLAVQIQEAWAAANNVNLLAADVSYPVSGATGSGIYAGRFGALNSFISETQEIKILKANVPCDLNNVDENSIERKFAVEKNEYSARGSSLNIWQENLKDYTVKFLDFSKKQQHNGKICHKQFCCEYSISVCDRGNLYNSVRYISEYDFHQIKYFFFRFSPN